ncbi:hypothetical protein ACFFJI_06640 [Allobacillus sp. GCM10007491]|uniref:Uncharacterized protein n=2 Tax=Allobacillus TaxID=1400133 RepID=A0A941CVE1_9BACI|nr:MULTISPECIES: hypothetical protein [Allobacillus]MBR7552915.1 hypothetical protein [Allobacillus saliphilus]TSJ67176.1 hypothetical protein FPQ13_02665 [Allobacillus salarius]
MSWKGIELQVALPRVQENSQLQDQLQQRGKQSQNFLGQSHLEEAEKMRKSVLKSEQKDQVQIHRDADDSHSDQQSTEHHRKRQRSDAVKLNHPYLGKKIDYSS